MRIGAHLKIANVEPRGARLKVALEFADVGFKFFRPHKLILALREKIVQIVKEGAGRRQLLVIFQAKLLHPAAQKDPDIDFIEQLPFKMAPEQNGFTE